MPVTKVRFRMFAPITFPKLNSGTLDRAEDIPTKSSGIEVAKAIMINAAVNSGIRRKRAILLKDLTKRLPLIIRTTQDITKYKIFISIFLFF